MDELNTAVTALEALVGPAVQKIKDGETADATAKALATRIEAVTSALNTAVNPPPAAAA